MSCKIITVMPIVQGAGCKFMTTSMAYTLKQQEPNKKIALLDFDFYEPYLAESLTSMDKIHRIDTLIDKIDSDTLDGATLDANFVKVDRMFDVLKGTRMFGRQYVFNEKHMTTILDYVERTYDYCFIAVSPFADNAGTIFGLHRAHQVVLVSQLNLECKTRFKQAVDIAKHYSDDETKIALVYNFRTQTSDEDFTNEVIGAGNVVVIGALPFIPSAIDNKNIKPTLMSKVMSKTNSDFTKHIKPIVDQLLLQMNNANKK